MRRILFHRDFLEYTGGHGKVWDYFRHARALGWEVRVYLTPQSLRGDCNPWLAWPECIVSDWRPQDCDVLFLAGMDWAALDDPLNPPRPVINLVQHVRHAWPEHPLHTYLHSPARRICVSQPVADALLATGQVNGAITVIPAALDIPLSVTQARNDSAQRVVVAALKAPELGTAVAKELRARGLQVELLAQWMPRMDYLACVAAAAVVVTLPHPAEGFYLPALEAMALGVPVVTTDCVGSREYSRDGINCVITAPEVQALVGGVVRVLKPGRGCRLRHNGQLTAAVYSQQREREQFAKVIQSMEISTL